MDTSTSFHSKSWLWRLEVALKLTLIDKSVLSLSPSHSSLLTLILETAETTRGLSGGIIICLSSGLSFHVPSIIDDGVGAADSFDPVHGAYNNVHGMASGIGLRTLASTANKENNGKKMIGNLVVKILDLFDWQRQIVAIHYQMSQACSYIEQVLSSQIRAKFSCL